MRVVLIAVLLLLAPFAGAADPASEVAVVVSRSGFDPRRIEVYRRTPSRFIGAIPVRSATESSRPTAPS